MENENKPPKISILKPKKSRNPLSDIDLEAENLDENNLNIVKTARRVSFASNNSIKPFATDPEKNTIWDLTYEESLEKSETSESVKFLDQANIDKENIKDLNQTLIDDDDELDLTPIPDFIQVNSAIFAKKESNKTILDGMEFTEIININDAMETVTTVADIDYTVPISNFIINKPENTDLDMSIDETNMVPTTIQLKTNFDISSKETNIIPTSTQLNTNFDMSIEENSMISTAIQLNTENVSVVSENMFLQLESLNTINTSLDDTQHLINYNLSNRKKSDFSKVISGETVPSFPDLANMPLRGINSTSFVENFNNKDDANFRESVELKEQFEASSIDDQFRKISMQETSFQDNTSDILCLENSILPANNDNEKDLILPQSPQVQACHTTTQNENQKSQEILDETRAFLDRVPLFDFSSFNKIKAKRKERDARHEEILRKFIYFLEKRNNRMNEQLEQYIRIKGYIEEFNKIEQRINEIYGEKGKLQKNILKCLSQESVSTIEILTWRENIVKLSEESEGYWNILSFDETFYKFNTLFKTIVLSVEVNEDGKVLHIDLKSNISEKSLPIALYVHKIFLNKLAPITLNSALGKQFDVLSLLDYVKITMENLLKIDKEFDDLEMKYDVQMDDNFKIYFRLVSVNLVFSWRFIINVSDFENINGDSVTYFAKVGQLRETDIKKCINKSPNGFPFVKAFIESLHQLKCQWEACV